MELLSFDKYAYYILVFVFFNVCCGCHPFYQNPIYS